MFEYAGIVFEEDRRRTTTVNLTDASRAYLFPVGVPGLFRQYTVGFGGCAAGAPADFAETTNTIGLPPHQPGEESA